MSELTLNALFYFYVGTTFMMFIYGLADVFMSLSDNIMSDREYHYMLENYGIAIVSFTVLVLVLANALIWPINAIAWVLERII